MRYATARITALLHMSLPVPLPQVDAISGDIQVHTPIAEMKERALQLYAHHREHIEAPLL